MSCPTCDHTMQHVGITGNGGAVHWCPRCGTVSQTFGTSERHDYLPKLVERCREFEERRRLVAAGDFRPWWTTGVADAIRLPAERLTPERY